MIRAVLWLALAVWVYRRDETTRRVVTRVGLRLLPWVRRGLAALLALTIFN